MSDTRDPGPRQPLAPGTHVEVRTGFDRSWASGFAVESGDESGYTIRRRSDGQVLPARFAVDAVRRERNRSMWWY